MATRTAARRATAPKTPKRDGDRLQRAVRLGDDRRQGMVGDLVAAWGEAGDLAFDEGHRGCPSRCLDAEGQRHSTDPRAPAPLGRRLASAGMNVGRMSTSSSTISELNDARPTIFMFIRSAGGTAFVPNPGRLCCAFE